MSWNFPCSRTADKGPAFTRGQQGMIFETGPGGFRTQAAQPFTENMTYLFSFLARTGWTADSAARQYLSYMGRNGGNSHMQTFATMNSASDSKLSFIARNDNVGADRYVIDLGDEDGTSWLSFDKWYQIGIAFSGSALTFAVNGSATPKRTITTNSPGTLELAFGTEKLWINGGSVGFANTNPTGLTSGWPSLIVGPGAMSTTVLDFDNATVRDRIWDSSGEFKPPGEDGSLWFGDTYADDPPESFFMDGSARFNEGGTMTWGSAEGGGGEGWGIPGALKKMFE